MMFREPEEARPIHDGFYWGLVVSTKDPKNKRRIQVRVPEVLGKTVSEWAEPDSLVISKLKVGDKVWVRFLHSDLRYPVYHIPHDVENLAYLLNDEDELELTHPKSPVKIRAPQADAMVSGDSSSVNLTGGKVQCQGKDGGGFVPCVASEFQLASTQDLKQNIQPFAPNGVQPLIVTTPIRQWNYKPEHADPTVLHVGPMLENLPQYMRRGNNVDLANMVGVLWRGLQQAMEDIADLWLAVSSMNPLAAREEPTE